jgi:hypothetical protein
MKKILVVLTAAFALSLLARPAHAEEKNPNKLFTMLTDKLASVGAMAGEVKTNPKFKEFIKYTCQKGSMLGGVFGVCRSGEGVVCGLKKEAFVACSIICGTIAGDMAEAAGFAESKCVVKHGKEKWGFADHHAAVQFAKDEIKTKAATVPALVKICGVVKKIAPKLPPEAQEFASACP